MLTRRAFMLSGAALSAVTLSGYSIAVEPNRGPLVIRYEVSPPDWRPIDGVLRIGIVADLHACDPFMSRPRIEEIVATANELRPDIFVLLGDFVEGLNPFFARPLPMDDWTAPLADLHAPLGTWSILGNHDFWHGDVNVVKRAMDARRLPLMENDAELIALPGGGGFWLGGLGDQLADKATKTGVDDLDGLTARIPNDGRPAILLAHEPDIFPRVPDRYGLTLSGHTHGGQIRLPLLGRFPVASHYGQRYAYGHIHEGNRHLIISAGLGCSGLPIRFGVPPELVVVDVGTPQALAARATATMPEDTIGTATMI
ncbi:MAG: metallophosphoesterase [Bauldia sp.]